MIGEILVDCATIGCALGALIFGWLSWRQSLCNGDSLKELPEILANLDADIKGLRASDST